eukprot:PITA_12764
MAASSSTAAQSNNHQWFDVFINHRGPDAKETFARPLYLRLLSNGLRAFLDKDEMQPGYNFPRQIEHAIRTASVHVAIFSPRYAESYWCLNELLLMSESKAPIIPVFYRVTPAEVRWTQGKDGNYAQALQQLAEKKTKDPRTHKMKRRYDSKTIENWRNALSRVADNSGFELEVCNGEELQLELLDKLVEWLSKMVKRAGLHVAKYPTGLAEKLKDLEDTVLLQHQQSGKPRILGIVGLGGVGKTTLAKEFFNRRISEYQKTCFLSDIRDNAAKGSLTSLQRKLLKALSQVDKPIDSVDEGKGMLIEPLKSSNALIILDDVDDVNQVDALLPIQNHYLRSSSLILITTRDKRVLSSMVENSSIYTLTGLNPQHSRELFCFYAFSQPDPKPGFESLVDKFIDSCNGLPLSLKVFGAHLYGGEIDDWEDELRSLQKTLPSEIKERLKISYDALNEEEKQIFLDVACFLIGQTSDTAIRIWDASGWNGRRGFQNLQNKCLLEVDSSNRIHMHDHLRDMGRDIAENSKLRRRLWRWTEDVIDDLVWRSSEITVRGVRMVMNEYHPEDLYSAIVMRRLQLLDIEGALLDPVLGMVEFPNLIWLRWNMCPSSSLPSSIPMKNLRVLQVSGGQLRTLWQDESQAPLQLLELEISEPLLDIPKSIGQLKYLERIVIDGNSSFERVNVQITKLPKEFCDLQSLETLVLRNCTEMMSLPNSFGNLSNLQYIDLSGCEKLHRIPKSFGNLTKLKYLDLSGCNQVTFQSEALEKISTLQHMDLSNCEKIEILPQQVAHQRSLLTLRLKGTDLKELPSAIGELRNLEVLELGSPLLDRLPPSLVDLRNLKELTIWDCKGLKCLPPSLGNLCNLKILTIWGCEELKYLPPSLGDLMNLKELVISRCEQLKCLPASVGQLSGLTKLAVYECPIHKLFLKSMPRLRELSLAHIKISEVPFTQGACPNLEILHISECNDLVNVGTLPHTLIELEFIFSSNLRNIKGLWGLAKLERLVFDGCPKIETLPSMESYVSLKKLWISGCVEEKCIRGLAQLRRLISFYVFNCDKLEQLEGVEQCMMLRELYILDCPKLQWGEGTLEQLQQQVEDCKFGSAEEHLNTMIENMKISRID